MSNNKKQNSKIIRRIKSFPTEIYLLFSISIMLILIIELGLKNIEAPIKLFFIIGNIVLNVCYSIVAATIFYFLIQPRSRTNPFVWHTKYTYIYLNRLACHPKSVGYSYSTCSIPS